MCVFVCVGVPSCSSSSCCASHVNKRILKRKNPHKFLHFVVFFACVFLYTVSGAIASSYMFFFNTQAVLHQMVFTQTCIQARTCSQKPLFAQRQGSFKSLYKIRSSHLRASAKSETWAKGQRKSLQNQNCSILKGCFQHLRSGDLWEIGLWSADGN